LDPVVIVASGVDSERVPHRIEGVIEQVRGCIFGGQEEAEIEEALDSKVLEEEALDSEEAFTPSLEKIKEIKNPPSPVTMLRISTLALLTTLSSAQVS
jgi:hypothetical protein